MKFIKPFLCFKAVVLVSILFAVGMNSNNNNNNNNNIPKKKKNVFFQIPKLSLDNNNNINSNQKTPKKPEAILNFVESIDSNVIAPKLFQYRHGWIIGKGSHKSGGLFLFLTRLGEKLHTLPYSPNHAVYKISPPDKMGQFTVAFKTFSSGIYVANVKKAFNKYNMKILSTGLTETDWIASDGKLYHQQDGILYQYGRKGTKKICKLKKGKNSKISLDLVTKNGKILCGREDGGYWIWRKKQRPKKLSLETKFDNVPISLGIDGKEIHLIGKNKHHYHNIYTLNFIKDDPKVEYLISEEPNTQYAFVNCNNQKIIQSKIPYCQSQLNTYLMVPNKQQWLNTTVTPRSAHFPIDLGLVSSDLTHFEIIDQVKVGRPWILAKKLDDNPHIMIWYGMKIEPNNRVHILEKHLLKNYLQIEYQLKFHTIQDAAISPEGDIVGIMKTKNEHQCFFTVQFKDN